MHNCTALFSKSGIHEKLLYESFYCRTMDEESMSPDMGLGLSLAEMIFKFSKKSFKWNWGEYRAEIITEFGEKYPESKDILIDVLSKQEFYDNFKKLSEGFIFSGFSFSAESVVSIRRGTKKSFHDCEDFRQSAFPRVLCEDSFLKIH